jgi:hypothetical protein
MQPQNLPESSVTRAGMVQNSIRTHGGSTSHIALSYEGESKMGNYLMVHMPNNCAIYRTIFGGSVYPVRVMPTPQLGDRSARCMQKLAIASSDDGDPWRGRTCRCGSAATDEFHRSLVLGRPRVRAGWTPPSRHLLISPAWPAATLLIRATRTHFEIGRGP